jgi:hypothetical protein
VQAPRRAGNDWAGIEDGDGSCFVSVAPLVVDGLKDGAWDGTGAAGPDLPAQRLLIGFELDDEMGFYRGGRGEGFF